LNAHHDADPYTEAAQAADGLREALRARGITLPRLAPDFAATLAGFPMVCLGTVPAETVRRITVALTE
jgi:hypothetical protein